MYFAHDGFSGDWGSAAWTSTGPAGQEASCATRTGYSTCEAYMRERGGDLTEACECLTLHILSLYPIPLSHCLVDWAINSVVIYQLDGITSTSTSVSSSTK